MHRPLAIVAALALLLGACAGGSDGGDPQKPAPPAMDDVVRMNQVQVLGTHNSYHRRLPPKLLDLLRTFDAGLADSVDYEHRPLDEQLDAGIRQLELDVFADPEGGRFASRAAYPLIGQPRETGEAELERPGFKVFHLPEIDFESTCLSLASCLGTIDRWSEANPRHLPIMVFIEPKDSPVPDVAALGFVTPIRIGTTELDALDAEIRSLIDDERLLTPDDVRGDAPTLRDAVVGDGQGWPTLATSRGKVLFCLINGDDERDTYLAGHPSLEGRAMFALSATTGPEAAVVSRPDPRTSATEIDELARQGFLVRTRADADTVEARTGDTTRRDAALASAATWISTDFPAADQTFPGAYRVELPARCHPITAPPECNDGELE